MKKEYTVTAVVRTFNNSGVVEAVSELIRIKLIEHIVVAINTDTGNKGEGSNGAFTKSLLRDAFSFHLNGKLIIHTISKWGLARALNEAISMYQFTRLTGKKDIILNISVESKIDINHVKKALALFEKYEDLAVVGIKRKIKIGEDIEGRKLETEFKDKLQYQVPQNTVSFWRGDLLHRAGYFKTECDSSGQEVEIDSEKIPVAGMEDFPTLLWLVNNRYKWAMIGNENPIIWDLAQIRQDAEQWKDVIRKMKRQEKVMEIWAEKFYNLSLSKAIAILKKTSITQ